jgi:hypothetical protein
MQMRSHLKYSVNKVMTDWKRRNGLAPLLRSSQGDSHVGK